MYCTGVAFLTGEAEVWWSASLATSCLVAMAACTTIWSGGKAGAGEKATIAIMCLVCVSFHVLPFHVFCCSTPINWENNFPVEESFWRSFQPPATECKENFKSTKRCSVTRVERRECAVVLCGAPSKELEEVQGLARIANNRSEFLSGFVSI